MKIRKLIILVILLHCQEVFVAQQNNEAAFSKSYLYEYDSQYTKAIKSLQDLKLDTYEINFRLGWLYYLSKDYAKSETFYRKAISQEPASVEARFGLVLPLSALGNWNSVLTVYLEILKTDPNNSIANYRTASIYYSRNDFSNCLSYVNRVVKMYPFDFDSNLLAGKALLAQGKKQDARKFAERAIEYNPQSDEAKTLLKQLQK